MTQDSRIVVGYDASEASDRALRWATRTARAQRVPLCVRVVASGMDPVVHSSRALNDLYAHRRLARAAAVLDELGVQDLDLSILHGPVFPTLLAEVGENGTLVVGSDGHGPVEGLVHGSVSQQVARYSHGPVIVVRDCEEEDARRIVVGVDGWPASLAALRWAAERASATDEELLAVTVVETRRGRKTGRALDARTRERQDLAVLRLHRELATVYRAHPGLRAQQETCAGDVRDLLTAHSRHASLLVLGISTSDPLLELAVGSVSQDLMARARCPVALIRASRPRSRRVGSNAPATL